MMTKIRMFLKVLMIVSCLQFTFRTPDVAIAAASHVSNGIDVLVAGKFNGFQGKRVGLITNHTGLSFDGESSIDLINKAPGVRLVALFSPEHGIRGKADEKYASGVDKATGLPVFSLYGATCRPLPEMLHGIDVLMFDIQDIGTRFYTYIGTLSLAMQAAKNAGIEFVVLDRPNPISGTEIGGAVPKESLTDINNGCGDLTSIHPIPTRHGMTIGELAKMFNDEFGIGCNLKVIAMQGWHRDMYFDETGQKWIPPSPNMTSLAAAILYPGFGILESTNLSVGRGSDHPFQIYGAPWVDNKAVIANLASRGIKGLKFTPCSFVPSAPHPYAGKLCFGVRIDIINRNEVDPILAGMQFLQAFFETHPKFFRARDGFATEIGDSEAWSLLTGELKTSEKTAERWAGDLEHFSNERKKFLLY